MRLPLWTKIGLTLMAGPFVAGCGIIIGNPGNPAEGSGTNSEFVETIDYDIPTAVSGYELTADSPPDGIFDDSARRIDQTIAAVNAMMTQLNQDAVESVGDFTGKGKDFQVSGRIVELTDSPTYNYKATICYKGKPFQLVEWSSTTGSVHTLRDHSVDPVDSKRAHDQVSEIVYTKGTTATIDVWLTATAPNPIPGADGRILADHTHGTLTNGLFTLAGVHNWVEDLSTITSEGDEYFIGSFNEEGVGEDVTFNAFRPDCTPAFDDTAAEHIWCGGRSLPGGTAFGTTERAAAAERLKSISVPMKTSLKQPALPDGLSCPN